MKRTHAQIGHSRNCRSSIRIGTDLSASSRSWSCFTISATEPVTRGSACLQLCVLRSGKVRTDPSTYSSSQEMSQRNQYCKNFRYHRLDNFEELHTLFHNTCTSGALGKASTHRAPTREECDQRMSQLRGGVSLGKSSGSRKRGPASVTDGRARRNAVQAAEMEYLEELKELAKSKRHRHGSGSSSRDDD